MWRAPRAFRESYAASGGLFPTVLNRWGWRFLYTKAPPPAESLDLQGGAQTPDASHATTRVETTTLRPSSIRTVPSAPASHRICFAEKASLAGLACYAPYRRSGIAPCPEGRFAGLPTRHAPGALITPHWPLSHQDRVYSTLA